MSKRFGLDVDGVLYQFQKTALYMLNSMKGYDLKLEDWNCWNWPKENVANNDWQWLWTAGVKLGLFRYGHLYKGAIEGVRALAELGDVVIITHRPSHAVQDTLDWLAYLKLPFTEIHLLTEGQAKSSVHHCDLYVDDKPENCLDYQRNTDGIPLLWTRPWNTSFQGVGVDPLQGEGTHSIRRIESWTDILLEAIFEAIEAVPRILR